MGEGGRIVQEGSGVAQGGNGGKGSGGGGGGETRV